MGSDGLLEPFTGVNADYGVRIHNPDGSLAEKSGNGLRIFAQWIANTTGARAFTISTGFCVVSARVNGTNITIEMGAASFSPVEVPVIADAPLIDEPLPTSFGPLNVTAVGVGNPHCVHFCQDPDALDWRAMGAEIESHPAFPNRVNVQFATVLGPQRLLLRIWERGAGETSASGSSSCAVAAVAVKLGLAKADSPITLVMAGGTLTVVVSQDHALTLTGPVEIIGQITLDDAWLTARGVNPR